VPDYREASPPESVKTQAQAVTGRSIAHIYRGDPIVGYVGIMVLSLLPLALPALAATDQICDRAATHMAGVAYTSDLCELDHG
jgi:hypothetical protein